MNITLPTIPAGVLVLLGLLAPYVQALIQRPAWSPTVKKIVAVVVAIILTAIVLAFYYVYTGDTIPQWPVLVLLAIVVAQASYTLVTKSTATALEQRTSPTITVHESGTDGAVIETPEGRYFRIPRGLPTMDADAAAAQEHAVADFIEQGKADQSDGSSDS